MQRRRGYDLEEFRGEMTGGVQTPPSEGRTHSVETAYGFKVCFIIKGRVGWGEGGELTGMGKGLNRELQAGFVSLARQFGNKCDDGTGMDQTKALASA